MEMLIGCIRGRSITPPVWVITLPTRTSIQALTRFTLPVRNFPMNLFIERCQSAEVFSFGVGVLLVTRSESSEPRIDTHH